MPKSFLNNLKAQKLNLDKYPLTKIVATLGPASEEEDTIQDLILAGMNVARINCSHGDWQERSKKIERVRKISSKLKRSVGILVDLQGPKIRTGSLPEEGLELVSDEELVLVTEEKDANYLSKPYKVFIRNYPELPQEVEENHRILLDDGKIRLKVLSKSINSVRARVTFGGLLKSNKGVNLPESTQLNIQAITPKDREDIKHAVRLEADFIALSFVRRAEDIIELRELIAAENPSFIPKTIAKIEKPQALDHLDSILDVVDGVMVARGDLGVELEPEKVPIAQKEIIKRANQKTRFVITATQMMDSMVNNPFPTRAEVSDVANAILDGTDALMLSNETAIGKFPFQTVDYMRKIALELELNIDISFSKSNKEEDSKIYDQSIINNLAIAKSVVDLANLDHVRSIVSFSSTGNSVQLISKFRPKARIIAATTFQPTYNFLSIIWGVTPIHFDQIGHTAQTIANMERRLREEEIVQEDETIVLTGAIPLAAKASANFIKLHLCDGSIEENL
jgi:pyruvate kinase